MEIEIVFYICGVVICVILNLIVIWVRCKKDEKTNCTDILIISLSICDLLKALDGYSLEINYSLKRSPSIRDEECELAGFSITFLGKLCFY